MWKNFLKLGAIAIASIALVACENNGEGTNTAIDGVNGPNVSVTNGYVITTMVFKNITIDAGVTIPIPDFGSSTVYVGPDFETGGTLLQLSVLAADFFDGQDLGLAPQTLPGGRLLPTVASGALPAVAITVPQLNNTVFYVGSSVLGFFVPYSGMDLAGAIASFNFYDTNKKKVGTLSLVGEDANGENSGILLLLSTSLLGIESYRAQAL